MGPSCDPYVAEKLPDECICEPTRCQIDDDCDDDYNDCTEGLCSDTSRCSQPAVMDGIACAGGTCEAGVCSLTTTVLPCSDQADAYAIEHRMFVVKSLLIDDHGDMHARISTS